MLQHRRYDRDMQTTNTHQPHCHLLRHKRDDFRQTLRSLSVLLVERVHQREVRGDALGGVQADALLDEVCEAG